MKNKGLEDFHYVKQDHISENEGSDVSISQNKMHIDTTSEVFESHIPKKGRGSGSSKKNCSSTGVQFLKDTNMIGSNVQGDTSNLGDTNSTFYVEDLSAEDEIYTFQCPETFIRQNLFNQTFDFGTVNKMVDAKTNEVLQLNVLPVEKKSITIAMPRKGKSGVLIKLPVKGHILVKKVAKTPSHHHEITNKDRYTCETHDNLLKELKTRHPLLGINWKVHIDLADEALKRQNKRIKKEMKKKLKLKKTENHKRENEFDADCLHSKKKRKRDSR